MPNWPIRYAAVDESGRHVVAAGRYGFCFYSLATRRWRLFGNVRHEREFFVSGGVCFWRDRLIVIACYCFQSERNELRCYSLQENLGDSLASSKWPAPTTLLLLNCFNDYLLAFAADGNVLLLAVVDDSLDTVSTTLAKQRPTTPSYSLHLVQIIDINNVIPHPACVLSIDLSSVRTESLRSAAAADPEDASRHAESLLINVAGRLIMIQRDSSSSNNSVDESRSSDLEADSTGGNNERLLMPSDNYPVMLASCVENFWVENYGTQQRAGRTRGSQQRDERKPHLSEALWMQCGAHGE